jgi:hypothetical protein
MKAFTLTTIMALAVVLPLLLRLGRAQVTPVPKRAGETDLQNQRYDIEDFIA